MKPTRTWILIADASRAHVLESLGPKAQLTRVDGLEFSADLPPTREIVDDRQGRTFDSAGPGRHAYEPRTDPHRALKGDFAGVLADAMSDRLQRKEFDRLVVVAPPTMLGELRSRMPEPLRAAVSSEVDKDLTKIPDHEIGSHLEDVI